MPGDASGTGGDENDGQREPSETTPDVFDAGTATESRQNTADTDSKTDDYKSPWEQIPIDLSADADESGDAEGEDDGYTSESGSTPIESGEPNLEHAVFVVFGVIAMILILIRIVSIPL